MQCATSGYVSYLQSTPTATLLIQTASVDLVCWAGFTAVCKTRNLNHSPRVNNKHGLPLHHTRLSFQIKNTCRPTTHWRNIRILYRFPWHSTKRGARGDWQYVTHARTYRAHSFS